MMLTYMGQVRDAAIDVRVHGPRPRRAHLRVIVAKAAARVEGALAQASRCL